MNNDGAKIPPDPPEPNVTEVANIFTNIKIKAMYHNISPLRARLMVS